MIGNYVVGMLVYDSFVFLEGLVVFFIVFLGGDFWVVVIIFIFMCLIGLVIYYSYLWVRVFWLYLGFGYVNFEEFK